MYILLGLLLPLLIYAGAALRFRRRGAASTASLAVAAALAFALATWMFWLFVLRSPLIRDAREIAWVSAASRSAATPLRFSAPALESSIGWPSGAGSPDVTFLPGSAARVEVRVAGGEGFLRVPEKCTGGAGDDSILLGGLPVPQDRDRNLARQLSPSVRGFALLDRPVGWFGRSRRLEVWLPEGKAIAGTLADEEDCYGWWNFGARNPGLLACSAPALERIRKSPSRLSDLLRDRLRDLRRSGGEVAELGRDLEEWAEGIVVTESDAGGFAAQTPESPAVSSRISTPCGGIRAFSPGSAATWLAVGRGPRGEIRVDFEPPWKRATSLPPDRGPFVGPDGNRVLTVAAIPQPGEAVFLLPLRGPLAAQRRNLTLAPRGLGHLEFAGPTPGGTVPGGNWKAVTSAQEIDFGDARIGLAIARFLPKSSSILLVVSCSWILLLFLFQLARGPRQTRDESANWARLSILLAVILVAWLLLLFRLALALRYAAGPASLDNLAIRGVLSALGTLYLGPATIALMVISRHRGPAESRAFFSLVFLSILNVLVFLSMSSLVAPQLWGGLAREIGPLGLSGQWIGLLVVTTLLLVGLFVVDGMANRTGAGDRVPREWFERLVRVWASGPWHALEERSSSTSRRSFAFVVLFVLGAILPVLVGRGLPLLGIHVGAAFSELGLTFVALSVAAFWLGAKDLETRRWRRVSFTACLPWMISTALMLVGLPIAAGDVGAAYGGLVLFLAVSMVLLGSPPRMPGAMALGSVVLAVVVASALLVNWQNLSGLLRWAPLGNLGDRVVAFREGTTAQKFALDKGVSEATKLRNAVHHVWANRALVHLGGWSGSGLGDSPARRVSIAQNTLQVDSVFSGFVAADYGLIGGISLLLLAAAPLFAFIVFRQSESTAGYLFSLLIAAWLLLEALIHAAMNLGILPFSGRNFPLLSVQSPADFARWTLLLGLATRALYWGGDTHSEPPHARPELAPLWLGCIAVAGLGVVAYAHLRLIEGRPMEIGNASAEQGKGSAQQRADPDPESLTHFTWRPLLDEIDARISRGEIALDLGANSSPGSAEDCARGVLVLANGDRDDEISSLLEDEVANFNALRPEAKLGEGARLTRAFRGDLAGVRSSGQFWQVLARQANDGENNAPPRPPSFLRIAFREHPDDGGVDDCGESGKSKEPPEPQCVVSANPEANAVLTLRSVTAPDDLPEIRIADRRQKSGQIAAVGPAWVMGNWRSAVRSEVDIAWLENLARVADEDLLPKLEQREFEKRFGKLTLDFSWQAAAQAFARAKGVDLYPQTFRPLSSSNSKRSSSARQRRALPPRVAVAVLDASDGAVLALGGWPRMAVGAGWQLRSATGRGGLTDIVPPARWLERPGMPRELLSTFAGDRNFDPLPMGSITKPLWAAAALIIHPGLDERLAVRGPAEEEREIFGVDLQQPPWQVGPSGDLEGGMWTDFRSFIARSDNRYAIRIGFLGLAEALGGNVTAERSVIGGLGRESLDGGLTAWRSFPRFPPALRFSSTAPHVLAGLDRAPLFRRMWTMFRLASTRESDETKDIRYRVSFWTGAEKDDLALLADRGVGEKAVENEWPGSSRLAGISPAQPNLELNLFGRKGGARCDPPRPTGPTARDYISILLGGSTNAWANVEFAAAFSSLVSGQPVMAHIAGTPSAPREDRSEFTATSRRVRPGLEAVITGGTANGLFRANGRSAAWQLIQNLDGVHAYAKTGTLHESDTSVSRITITLVRWKDEKRGIVDRGLTFSFAAVPVPDDGTGMATRWAREFFEENADLIREHFTRGQVARR